MGTWIGYRHRTKDIDRVKKLILDLKVFAENTGRKFKVINSVGFSADKSGKGDTARDKKTLFEFEEKDYSKNKFMPSKNVKPSREVYFEMEIIPGIKKDWNWYGVGWHFRDGWWIANGKSKIYPGIPRENVVMAVISIVGILEYIKSRYFPNFMIDDQFDFHINYVEKSDSDKAHLKACSEGYFEYLRRPDGTFRDYVAEEKAKKNHDINNIIKEVTGMDQVTGFIKSDLLSKGFKKEHFVPPGSELAKKLFPDPKVRGVIKTYVPEGNQLIKGFHNTLDDVIVQSKRKRRIVLQPRRKPISRIKIKRKDGVVQHYHKRLK